MMRFYKATEGRFPSEQQSRTLPSVTTILKATRSAEQQMLLDQCYMDATTPTQFRNNDDSKRRGEAIDCWAKALLMDKPLPAVDWKFAVFQKQLKPLLEYWKRTSEWIEVDLVVFDLARGYAGTLDILLLRGGRWMVVDIKTCNFLYEPAIEEGFLQVCAYAEALRCDGIRVNSLDLVTVTPKMLHESCRNPLSLSAGWAARLQAYRALQMGEGDV